MPCANLVEIDPVVLEIKKKKCYEFRIATMPATTTDITGKFRSEKLNLAWGSGELKIFLMNDEFSFKNKQPSRSLSIRHSRT